MAALQEGNSSTGRWGRRVDRASDPLEDSFLEHVSPDRLAGLDLRDTAAESAAAPRVWRPTLRPPAPERETRRPAKAVGAASMASQPEKNTVVTHSRPARNSSKSVSEQQAGAEPIDLGERTPKKLSASKAGGKALRITTSPDAEGVELKRPGAAVEQSSSPEKSSRRKVRSKPLSSGSKADWKDAPAIPAEELDGNLQSSLKGVDEELRQAKTPEKTASRKTRVTPANSDPRSDKVSIRSEPGMHAVAGVAPPEDSHVKVVRPQSTMKATDVAVKRAKSPKTVFSIKRRSEPVRSETAREGGKAAGDAEEHATAAPNQADLQVAIGQVRRADVELAESPSAQDVHSPAKKSSGTLNRKLKAPEDASTDRSKIENVQEAKKTQRAGKILDAKVAGCNEVDTNVSLRKTGRAWRGRRSETARPAEERELEQEEDTTTAKHDALSVVTTTDGTTSEQRLETCGNDNQSTELSQEAHDTDSTLSETSVPTAVPVNSTAAEDPGVPDPTYELASESAQAVAGTLPEQEVRKQDVDDDDDDDVSGGAAEIVHQEAHFKSFGQKVALFDRRRSPSDVSSATREQQDAAEESSREAAEEDEFGRKATEEDYEDALSDILEFDLNAKVEKDEDHDGEERFSVSSALPAANASEAADRNHANIEERREETEGTMAETVAEENHAEDEAHGQVGTHLSIVRAETHGDGTAAETTEQDGCANNAEEESVEGDSFLAVCAVCGAVHLVQLDIMAMDLNFKCAEVGAECEIEAGSEAQNLLLDAKAASDAKVAPLTAEERQHLAKRHEASWGSSKEARKEAAKHLQEVSASGKLPKMRYLDGRIVTWKGEKQLVTLLHPQVNSGKKQLDRDCAVEPVMAS
eukprot:TRINITY_DN5155_c0_g2_i1.p1 TRINITY_DN5155_c0_g2~~TRINITY_DN5155_c0_g2_i1.p1  ORF type:complete len:879 (-),score=228.21 TRINITY_DN5155_c0_g2_i1:624-3224(-)